MSLHAPDQDTAEGSFLTFLEKDIVNRSGCIRPVTAKTFAEAERLTAGIEVDIDEALPTE